MDQEFIKAALVGFHAQRAEIDKRIAELEAQLGNPANGARAKRVLSPAARRRIAAAQRTRWAAHRAGKEIASGK